MTINRAAFFAAVRAHFGALKQPAVDGYNVILDAWDGADIRHLAYVLATAYHETAHTLTPLREYGRGRGKRYGETYYGRGSRAAHVA